jgi:hypothetical protein
MDQFQVTDFAEVTSAMLQAFLTAEQERGFKEKTDNLMLSVKVSGDHFLVRFVLTLSGADEEQRDRGAEKL